ncbi:MAG: bi-domain-containing oxidoreductase [Gammaproteobacteria bacterium]|nr:bi-domain-containing oxidoreductase [Gammaproteobacteria bacterium]
MKQILQDMGNGNTNLSESPAPSVRSGHCLIETSASLISVGTERMLVDFGKSNYLQKAKQQPDKVKMVLNKIKTDGLFTTVDAVRSKLAQPIPLGYCNVGKVLEAGNGVSEFKSGDRVVSNGPHAEIVRVGKNLCAKIPDNVDDESAAFTVLAAIGLQGVRLAAPTLGESVAVIGVGLIGLLTVQLLKANGCRVFAIDYDEQKLLLAEKFGAEVCNLSQGADPVSQGYAFSDGNGIDAVIITASTKSNDPVSQAAQMSRKNGRIVLVGVTGLELNRSEFYEKELSFQVSCSYGPGRYDATYEEKGQDYPIGLVRWTEQRNFEAILNMMSEGKLDLKPLISKRIEFQNAIEAYDSLASETSLLGIILQYTSQDTSSKLIKSIVVNPVDEFEAKKPVVAFIGAGNYASRVLIPAFKEVGAQLHSISTSSGINSVIHGAKNNFHKATTDNNAIFQDKAINTLAIVTQHDSHATFVKKALEYGKNVFVEKPLAINTEELNDVQNAYNALAATKQDVKLMVGFNRRFSPHVKKMKLLLAGMTEAKSILMTVNAGAIPVDHWIQDNIKGGGRIIGEACHFIDLMRHLVGFPIVSIQARRFGDNSGSAINEDKAVIVLGFEDGSFGTINYLANGASSFPKERIEVFCSGRILQLDNFRKMTGFGWKGFKKMNLWQQDKGQKNCVAEFLIAISEGKAPPIAIDEIFEVARVSIEVAEILRSQ